MDILDRSLREISNMIKNREVKPSEVAERLSNRIDEVEPKLNAYISLNERLIDDAKACDEKLTRLSSDEIPELFGVPISVKDNMNLKGMGMTCASKILENFVSPYDATVVEKLRETGAIFTGKTNMDEFAMGSSTETSYFGPTRNPWDLKRVPGGSSGGSAASVSARSAIAALGSDTGGSIRQPASLCGVVGLKPTYGRVSRYGLTAFASSLDQIGPITKNVEDAAYLLNVISGQDSRDATSARMPIPNFLNALNGDLKGLKAGLPKEYFIEGIDEEVKDRVLNVARVLEGLGVSVEEVSLPHTRYAVETYYIIAPAEASSNLGRFDGVRYGYRARDFDNLIDMYCKTRSEGFGDEVKRRIMIGTYTLSAGYYDAYYLKAQKVRSLIYQGFNDVFKDVDFLITPVSPTTAFMIGEKIDDPIKMYLSDIYTIAVNLAGLPAISLPCGFDSNGLPIGVQLIGRAFDEEIILKAGNAIEKTLKLDTMPKI